MTSTLESTKPSPQAIKRAAIVTHGKRRTIGPALARVERVDEHEPVLEPVARERADEAPGRRHRRGPVAPRRLGREPRRERRLTCAGVAVALHEAVGGERAEGAERAARWRALLDESLLRRRPTTRGQQLELRREPAVAAELDALVAAERECCAFLTLRVQWTAHRLVLDVAAPPEAREIVDAMLGT
jgi:hypothetical protein